MRFKSKKRFTYVQKLFGEKLHWEKCRGSWADNVEYCSKVNDWSRIHGNIPEASKYTPGELAVLKMFYEGVKWQRWQSNIITIVDEAPNARKVHWFWEARGGAGKSFLARWLCIEYRVQIGMGKSADIFNSIAKAMEKDPYAWPQVVLLDIPRSYMEYVNYAALEQLKNGMIFSGKYEGAQLIFPPPHVIVFANEPPNTAKLSADRWKVVELLHPPSV